MLNITDDKLLKLIEQEGVAQLMLEVCIVMYELGRPQVNIGALLRLAGMDLDIVEEYDTQAFLLDEEFLDSIEEALDEAEAEQAAQTTEMLH